MNLKKIRLLSSFSAKIALGMALTLPVTYSYAATEIYGGFGASVGFVQSGDITTFGQSPEFVGNDLNNYPSFNTQMGGEAFFGAMFGNFGAELKFSAKSFQANKDDLLLGINFSENAASIPANDKGLFMFDYTNMMQNSARISGVYKMNLGSFKPYVSAGVGGNVITGIPLSQPLLAFAVGGSVGTDFKISDKVSLYAAYDLDAAMSPKSKTSDVITATGLLQSGDLQNDVITYDSNVIPYDINQLSQNLSENFFPIDDTDLVSAYILSSDTALTAVNSSSVATAIPTLVGITNIDVIDNSGTQFLDFPLELAQPSDASTMIQFYQGETTGNNGALGVVAIPDLKSQSSHVDASNKVMIIALSSDDDVLDATKATYALITNDTPPAVYVQQAEILPTDGSDLSLTTGFTATDPTTAKTYTYEELKTVLESDPINSKKSIQEKQITKNKATKNSTKAITLPDSFDATTPLKFSSLLTHNISFGVKFNF